MLANGQHVGRYEILSAIGAGGMGEVYLAQDTRLGRKVALKILPAEFAEDKARMNRFIREAKSASALNHPNIITIHEIGESDGTHFIATEFIDGKTLSDFAKSKSVNYESALEIAIQVASALEEAHAGGIVHRDIKPDNVMIRANGLVKILDFGIAKLSGANAQPKIDEEAATAIRGTSPGMIIGTPNYMSPEQARGLGVDHQTDIFSFGIVLYEMLAGSSPFAGETVSDVIAAVLTKEPPPLTSVTPELAEIVSKTLQKDKRNRYRTAKDLLDDLKEVKQKLEIQTRLARTSSPNLEEPQTQILKVQTTEKTENQNSIAVLPFTNMSADEENEYFCDGLAEELLNALSKLEDLKVAARTSAFSFKGKNAEAREIGEKLDVKNILEGSVRRSGNKLRISVQLINAANGFQLWSERYDSEMKDIFDVQDEISLAVVDALKLKLFGEERFELLKKGTENADAYELYMRGRYFWNRRQIGDFGKAIEQFEKAIELDPGYALAYSGLADCLIFLGYYEAFPPSVAGPKAKAAVEKSVEMQTLAESQASMALYKIYFEFNWKDGEEGLLRAIEMNPKLPTARYWYCSLLNALGRFDESLEQGRIALELDPLNLIANGNVARCLCHARRFDEAIEHARRTLEIDPNFFFTHLVLGTAYQETGRMDDAIVHFRKAASSSDVSVVKSVLGFALAKSGKTDEARQVLVKYVEQSKHRYISPLCFCAIHIGLNEIETALDRLEEAWNERSILLMWVKTEPIFDTIRSEPRFKDVLKRMNLPE